MNLYDDQQNGFQRKLQGAGAVTGNQQFSSPAGTVTPPATTQGGGAGTNFLQAPQVQPKAAQQSSGGGMGGILGAIGKMGMPSLGSSDSSASSGALDGNGGIASTVGNRIGEFVSGSGGKDNKTTSAIGNGVSGAANGAAMGAKIGGPWGALAGGIGGALYGVGSSLLGDK